MKRLFVMTVAMVLLAGCARLPEILLPTTYESLPSHVRCRELFPQGRWQLHHAIDATVPGGRNTLLTGVTVLSASERSLASALMTVEGFVLFRGRDDGQLTVDRAIEPFDRPGFAQGLMDDLELLFLAPQAPLCRTGMMAPGQRICRYCLNDATVDIEVGADRTWLIRQYDDRRRLKRTVTVDKVIDMDGTPFAQKLTLKRHGLLGYQLDLTLLEAVALEYVDPERKTTP